MARNDVVNADGSINWDLIGGYKESLAQKTTDLINVVGLGADNTGVNDATTIIQNALNSYKVVYLPSGTYKITSLTVPEGVTLTGDGVNTVLNHISTTTPCIQLLNGYHGANVFNLKITGGVVGVYAIELHKPSCNLKDVFIDSYNGNGVDIGVTTANQGGYCAKLERFEFIGTNTSQTSNVTVETIGININVAGGNIIIDKSNVQMVVSGIKIQAGNQITISNSNISEVSSNNFPSIPSNLYPTAINISGGTNIGINNCYIENFTLGIYTSAVNQLTIDNCYLNGMSVASSGINLNTSSTQNVHIKDSQIITNYSGATSISLQNSPVGVIIENTSYDETKFGNNQNADFIYINNSLVKGNFVLSGKRRTVNSWNVIFGSTNGGTYNVGTGTDKYYSGMVYTDYGINNGQTPVYVLPSAPKGTMVTFIKTNEYKNSDALYVRPQASQYIFPTPATVGKGKYCAVGNTGSLILLATETGWCVLSQTGTWTDEV